VGITFDDGPAMTSSFVNALKSSGLTPVTFFVNGSQIGGNSNTISQMLSVGAVQSHGFDHNDPKSWSTQQVTDSLNQNNTAIVNAGAPKPTIYRPPYGSTSANITAAANALGMIVITWNVDSKDWDNASTGNIVNANKQLQNGQVILMHENKINTLSAIPQIAAALKANGMCPGKLDPKTGKAVAP
jgi:peptidoglycan/xylan/chitin deacetylase (PgdA/CDA1 family)